MTNWRNEAKKTLALMKQARDICEPKRPHGGAAKLPTSAVGGMYVVTEALPPKTERLPVDVEFCRDMAAAYSGLIRRYVRSCRERAEQERKQTGLFEEGKA